MRLRELLKVIDSDITFEIAGIKEKYDLKSTLPEEQMNYIVKSIKKTDSNSILIILEEPKKVETLEKLGYSFEAGM